MLFKIVGYNKSIFKNKTYINNLENPYPSQPTPK